MPRPEEFDREAERRSLALLEEYRRQVRDGRLPGFVPDAIFDMPKYLESWHAGCWLSNMLKEAGCPDGLAARVCFENGKRIGLTGGDPWEASRQTLQEFLAGMRSETRRTAREEGLHEQVVHHHLPRVVHSHFEEGA